MIGFHGVSLHFLSLISQPDAGHPLPELWLSLVMVYREHHVVVIGDVGITPISM